MTALNFLDGSVVPDVKAGAMLGCIIVIERRDGKRISLAAWYLNAFFLDHGNDCICESEKDHDDDMGCPTTGWFYDESNFEYENCFHPVDGTVLLWAPIPNAEDILNPSQETPR